MPKFEATCAKGLEYLLKDELIALGAEDVHEKLSRVEFEADWAVLYRALMWSRVASRILYPIAKFEAADEDSLYRQASIISWEQHIPIDGSFVVSAQSYRSKLNHTRYISQKIKDAIVDYFREQDNARPSVDLVSPDIALNCRIRRNQVTLSVDLAGHGLHQRGYRLEGGAAPIKENLAAALLYRAGWRSPQQSVLGGGELAANQKHLFDPMSGSATFLIEAAMMAFDIAPGLQRQKLTLWGWPQFKPDLWQSIVDEAKLRASEGAEREGIWIEGADLNPKAVANGQINVSQAGLESKVNLHICAIDQAEQLDFPAEGILIVNPPYSERLGEQAQVKQLYAQLGSLLRNRFKQWRAAVLSPQKEFGHQLGIRAEKRYQFNNGSIPCELLCFTVDEKEYVSVQSEELFDSNFRSRLSAQGIELFNRLNKNQKKIQRFLKSNDIRCYRLYDADLPEFNAAADIYHATNGDFYVYLQEYRAPASINEKVADKRLKELQRTVAGFMKLPMSRVIVKQRRRDKGGKQYASQTFSSQQQTVSINIEEFGRRFKLEFANRIDTGLFIDHRLIRKRLSEESQGKSMLNLFCYTASASVYAATGGAVTTSVDLSNTYLLWAKENFQLNKINCEKHRFIRDDCMSWIKEAKQKGERFDLIFVDPPTFSNSKKTEQDFDLQSIHQQLLSDCVALLSDEGKLYFSNNFQKFKMEYQAGDDCVMHEITRQTTSPDFARKSLHRCWLIEKKNDL